VFVDLEIKNYRSFADENPLRLQLRPGFTALIGPNNSGKSSVLKFFYELRPTLEALGNIANLANATRAP